MRFRCIQITKICYTLQEWKSWIKDKSVDQRSCLNTTFRFNIKKNQRMPKQTLSVDELTISERSWLSVKLFFRRIDTETCLIINSSTSPYRLRMTFSKMKFKKCWRTISLHSKFFRILKITKALKRKKVSCFFKAWSMSQLAYNKS